MGGRGSSGSRNGGAGSRGDIGGLRMADSEITKGYTNSTNGRVINQGLRNNLKLNPENREIVDRMDAAMQTTTRDMVVYREVGLMDVENIFSISPKENTFDALKESAIGSTFTDKGFMSTYHTAMGNQYGSAKMEIHAKAGTKALLTSNVKEAEVILGRNQKWKITDVVHKDGDIVFKITNK